MNFFRRLWINPILMVFLSLFFTSPCFAQALSGEISPDALSLGIQRSIERKILTRSFSCRGEILCDISYIPSFYKQRNYRPAWLIPGNSFANACELTAAIQDAEKEALAPENYHLSKIEQLLCKAGEVKKGLTADDEKLLIDLDLLLTDSFFLYASHLTSGRVNPETIHSEWEAFRSEIDLAKVLETALGSGEIQALLQALTPKHPGYIKLRDTLAYYRKIRAEGGWLKIAQGKTLKRGDIDDRVKSLKDRLWVTGDLNPGPDENKNNFDGILEEGVKRFQKRHGLAIDGAVGPKTIAALNVPVEDRARQIELNMERFRWIPGDLGKRYILVNIADFGLTVVENEKPVMKMKVVAGKPFRKSPVFSEKMKYIELNPYWNVPPQLAVKDVAPKVCRNSHYLSEKKMDVFAHWGEGASKINPAAIDWCHVSQKNFRYKLRQQPGPRNALGRIKFMFPNKYSVYLHDTPERALFDKTLRDFSSGCIRIEKPAELALYLLKNDPQWTREKLLADIASGEHKTVTLQEPVFVHLLYWTSWADAQGDVQFREDVYGRDIDLDRALKERPPGFYDEANR